MSIYYSDIYLVCLFSWFVLSVIVCVMIRPTILSISSVVISGICTLIRIFQVLLNYKHLLESNEMFKHLIQ